MRRLAATLVAIVALTACGGDTKDPVAAISKSGATAASSATAIASAAVASSTVAKESSAVAEEPAVGDAQATCEFLATIHPKLVAVGSPVGALAQLAGAYAAFVEKQPGEHVPNASELDAITSKECPAVRQDVLKVLEAEQFAGTL
ncbi:MAG: hypothetical protein ABIM89_05550 [Mycobacteriales bacterium]